MIFCGVEIHAAAPEFQYVLIERPQLLNPAWRYREKEILAQTYLKKWINEKEISPIALFEQVSNIEYDQFKKKDNMMGSAVELYFDHQIVQNIGDLRHALKQEGIPSMLSGSGDRPHISLAGFSNADRDVLISLVQEYAEGLEPFPVQLSAIGIFPTDENVLFLSPVPTFNSYAIIRNFINDSSNPT